tara:strand:+ start:232 stop:552 length:321 start_codon:yes stop_codon:yes gene_type:complete
MDLDEIYVPVRDYQALHDKLDAAETHIIGLKAWIHGIFTATHDDEASFDADVRAILAKTPAQSLAKVQAEAIRNAANTICPVSGHVVRSEQARCDLMDWADVVEKG